MKKSEIFKVAHAVAKANKKMGGGDYIVYLKMALIKTYKIIKNGKDRAHLFSAANRKLAWAGIPAKFFKIEEKNSTHGLLSFKKSYMMDKAERNLQEDRFLGKRFTSNGMICAWVLSKTNVQVAY